MSFISDHVALHVHPHVLAGVFLTSTTWPQQPIRRQERLESRQKVDQPYPTWGGQHNKESHGWRTDPSC